MNLLCGCCILFSGYFASYRASGKVALCLGAHNSDVAICMQVMLAKFRTERCAVKQIVCETKAEYRAAMQEMLLMQELQFDKIVRFFGAIKRGRGVLWMCMEYMPFSDLRKILHNSEHRKTVRFAESMLSLPRRLKWAKDVVAALDLLHSRAVVHRDLKPGNVLISNKGDAVLSDFGLSRVREAQQSRLQVRHRVRVGD